MLADNPILCSGIVGNYIITQGNTLETVGPNYTIKYIGRDFTNEEWQDKLSESANQVLHKVNKPWVMQLYINTRKLSAQNYKSSIYLQISILHALTDQRGLIYIAKEFGKGLRRALLRPNTLYANTKIKQFGPDLSTYTSVFHVPIGFITLPLYLIYIIYRICTAFVLLYAQIQYQRVTTSQYSGLKEFNPSKGIKTPQYKPTGIRVLEFDQETLERLMQRAQKVSLKLTKNNASINSILSTCCFIANQSISESYGIHLQHQIGAIEYDCRNSAWDVIDTPELSESFLCTSTLTLPITNYLIKDTDSFWSHCQNLNLKTNTLASYAGSFINLLSINTRSQRKINQKRDVAFNLHDLGKLNDYELKLSSSIEITRFEVCQSSFYSSRSLWSVSAMQNNGLKIIITYPAFMINEQDANLFTFIMGKSIMASLKDDDGILVKGVKQGEREQKLEYKPKKILKSQAVFG
jgi:hypothetical protein